MTKQVARPGCLCRWTTNATGGVKLSSICCSSELKDLESVFIGKILEGCFLPGGGYSVHVSELYSTELCCSLHEDCGEKRSFKDLFMNVTQSWSRGSCIPLGLFRAPVVEGWLWLRFIRITPSWNEVKCVLCPATQSGLLSSGETVYGSQGVLFTHIIPPLPADTDER